MINMDTAIALITIVICAPGLKGITDRTKSFLSGRKGASLFQPYFDLWRIFKKRTVYSKTTSWVFKAGPVIYFVSVFMALFFIPLGSYPALVCFQGDFIVLIYLLGLGRFFMVIAALDTGSSFEGMGASREVFFSFFAEIILFLFFIALVILTKAFSLTEMQFALSTEFWSNTGIIFFLIAAALFVVFLIENSRIPFDDPNTHLELTMVHEVMVLDHSGLELGLISYASQLKVCVLGLILIGMVIPFNFQMGILNFAVQFVFLLFLALIVGVIESLAVRFRLSRITQVLIGTMMISAIALVLLLGGR